MGPEFSVGQCRQRGTLPILGELQTPRPRQEEMLNRCLPRGLTMAIQAFRAGVRPGPLREKRVLHHQQNQRDPGLYFLGCGCG